MNEYLGYRCGGGGLVLSDHIAIYGSNRVFLGFWDEYFPNMPYNVDDAKALIYQIENIKKDDNDFSFIWNNNGLDEYTSEMDIFEEKYSSDNVDNVSDVDVSGFDPKVVAFMDGLNPEWRRYTSYQINPLLQVALNITNTLMTVKNGTVVDARAAGEAARPYAEIIGNSIVSVGVALTASDLVRVLQDWENSRISEYDKQFRGQYTRLPSDYYRNAYDPSTYQMQPVYDEKGNLILGVYTKAFDVNQDIGIEDLTNVGYGGLSGSRYTFENALHNAIFYATMYGLKQMIFEGKVYDVSNVKSGGIYSGVGNVPVGSPVQGFLPPWYYSKNMKLEGWGGWMKSKFGDYLIKKRY